MKKRAIITGISGQIGSYLADYLLSMDYDVYGIKKHGSSIDNIRHIEHDIEIIDGDIVLPEFLRHTCSTIKPEMFFNLAAQSHVKKSFDNPQYTLGINGTGTINCLEAIRQSGLDTRFFQASSTELFGGTAYNENEALTEHSTFHPRSPYACSKAFSHWITVNYREAHGMFACSGILSNNESPRRSPDFVTRKISLAVAKIAYGLQSNLRLGNLDSRRDWGHSRDYVKGIFNILDHDVPEDYILATGKTHSVREFCRIAFLHANLGDYRKYVESDPRFYRAAEVDILLGDSSKAKNILGWKHETSFEDLVKEMVDADMKSVEKEINTDV